MEMFYGRNKVSMRVPADVVENWVGVDLGAFRSRFNQYATRFKHETNRHEITVNRAPLKPNTPEFWALACQRDFNSLIVINIEDHVDAVCELFKLPEVFVTRLHLCDPGNVEHFVQILNAASQAGTVRELKLDFSPPETSSAALFSAILPHISTKFETVIFYFADFAGVDFQAFFDSRLTMSHFSLLFEDCDFYDRQFDQLASLLDEAGPKFETLQPPNHPNDRLLRAMENSHINKLIFDEDIKSLDFSKYHSLTELDLSKCQDANSIDAIAVTTSKSISTFRAAHWFSSYQQLYNFIKALEFNCSLVDIYLPEMNYVARGTPFWQQQMLAELAKSPVIVRIHFGKGWNLCRDYARMCDFKFELVRENVLERRFHPATCKWRFRYKTREGKSVILELAVTSQKNMYQFFALVARCVESSYGPCSTYGLRVILDSQTVLAPNWTPRHIMLKESWTFHNDLRIHEVHLFRGYQRAVLAFVREQLLLKEARSESSAPASRRRRLTASTDVSIMEQQLRVTLAFLPTELLKKIADYIEDCFVH
jgi:hypothetical protein